MFTFSVEKITAEQPSVPNVFDQNRGIDQKNMSVEDSKAIKRESQSRRHIISVIPKQSDQANPGQSGGSIE